MSDQLPTRVCPRRANRCKVHADSRGAPDPSPPRGGNKRAALRVRKPGLPPWTRCPAFVTMAMYFPVGAPEAACLGLTLDQEPRGARLALLGCEPPVGTDPETASCSQRVSSCPGPRIPPSGAGRADHRPAASRGGFSPVATSPATPLRRRRLLIPPHLQGAPSANPSQTEVRTERAADGHRRTHVPETRGPGLRTLLGAP